MSGSLDSSGAAPLVLTRRSIFARRDRRAIRLAVAGLLLLVGINIFVFLLPIDYASLGALAYAGVFVVSFVGNATTFVPIPYLPVVAQAARSADFVWLVVLLAALGSVLGESVAYAVGRTQEHSVEDHRFYRWLHSWLGHPFRAGIALFLLAVPLNPLFDVAGLAAGALGVRYRVYFVSVFAARILRMAVVAWIGFVWGGAV